MLDTGKLNKSQEEILTLMTGLVIHQNELVLWWVSLGASGKTFIFKFLCNCGAESYHAVSCSTSKCHSSFKGHYLFKMPVPMSERNQNLFIIEESLLTSVKGLSGMDRYLRYVTGIATAWGRNMNFHRDNFPYGLPVLTRNIKIVIIETCIKTSVLWPHFKRYWLMKIYS